MDNEKNNSMGNNVGNIKQILVKVFGEFVIIAFLFFVALSITHTKLIQLSKSVSAIMEPNIKLVNLREISGCLYGAEANVKAYTIKHDTIYLLNYENNISMLNKKMEILLLLSTKDKIISNSQIDVHRAFTLQIVALSELIRERVNLFNEYIELEIGKDSQNVLLLLREKIRIKNPIENNTSKQNLVTPKKTFFSELFKSNTFKEEQIHLTQPNILKILAKTQQEELVKEDKQLSKELNLTQREYLVMNKIFSLLKQMEKKELNEGIKRINIATENTSLQISFISKTLTAIGLLLAMIFAFFIYLDILRAIRFREEILEANRIAEQEKQKAEESTKLMEAFLANMSHEIRTPMNAIVGFSDILSKRELKEEEKEFVTIIKSAGENLLSIINDILDISKLEAGMIVFEEINFSIKDTFKSLYILLNEKAKKNNLELFFDYEEDHIPDVLLGDQIRLTQIIIILVDNAIKFTHTGSVHVYVRGTELKDGNTLLDFSVTDTGIGIPEDKLETIFMRFQQVNSHTSRKYGGTGLGLSIAKQMVEQQVGVISVKSELLKGSVFSFSIPYKKSSGAIIIPETLEMQCNIEELKKLNILVVEDNKLNIRLLKSLFSENNLTMQIVENGREAIEKLKENNSSVLRDTHFDIIMMDMEMPVMTGYEATTIIRNELKNDIPIIAMSAHAMAGEKEKCLSLGMNDYISKPINAILLFEKIYELTHKS